MSEVLEKISKIVGKKNIFFSSKELKPYFEEPRGHFLGKGCAVVFPQNTEQVSKIMALAYSTKTKVVPQSGNTGLVGGQQGFEEDTLILSLSKINKIRLFDVINHIAIVEAGVILSKLQEEASNEKCFFPLSLASASKAQIGGLLSTNAGGVNVLAYGSARDLCLGLEIVLPDGQILNDLRYVRKDNSGYDIKNLFIGAEGTLGIITAAAVKIFPKPKSQIVAYIAFVNLQDVQHFFMLARDICTNLLTAFELVPQMGIDLVLRNLPHLKAPFQKCYNWYVLLELSASLPQEMLQTILEVLCQSSIDKGIVKDVVVAQNEKQSQQFWQLRENLPEAQRQCGSCIKHDISVPLSVIPRFVKDAEISVLKIVPGAHVMCFGHIGDGNLHYNILQPSEANAKVFLDKSERLNKQIHDLAIYYGGSFSAEHGIGQLKRRELKKYKPPGVYQLMSHIKKLLDPKNIMNPGKIFFD